MFLGFVLLPEVFTCYLVSDSRGNLYLTKLDEPTISKLLSMKTIHSNCFRKKQKLGSRQHIFKHAVLDDNTSTASCGIPTISQLSQVIPAETLLHMNLDVLYIGGDRRVSSPDDMELSPSPLKIQPDCKSSTKTKFAESYGPQRRVAY